MFSQFKLSRTECGELSEKISSRVAKKKIMTSNVEGGEDASSSLRELLSESGGIIAANRTIEQQVETAPVPNTLDDAASPPRVEIDFHFCSTGPSDSARCLTWNPNWVTGKSKKPKAPSFHNLDNRVFKSGEIARRFVDWQKIREERREKEWPEANAEWTGNFVQLQLMLHLYFSF
jgi:hypothetical protein